MTRRPIELQGLDVFYPIVPDVGWLARLVPLGVKTVQLRVKDAPPDVVAREIAAGLDLCRRHGCQLIVDDYWREAIAAGADFVHLGQEDLAGADVAALKARGVRLGISTHSLEELAALEDISPTLRDAFLSGLAPVHDASRLPAEFNGAPNGHEGAHHFLADDFVTAVNTQTLPPVNAWQAARYNLPGIFALESARRGGERGARIPGRRRRGAPPRRPGRFRRAAPRAGAHGRRAAWRGGRC